MVELNRRNFFTGLGAGIIAAPAIVSFKNIMPIKSVKLVDLTGEEIILPSKDLPKYLTFLEIVYPGSGLYHNLGSNTGPYLYNVSKLDNKYKNAQSRIIRV